MACLHCVGLRAAAGAVDLPMRRLADADRVRSAEIRCLVTSILVFQLRGGSPYAKTRISAERCVPACRPTCMPRVGPAHARLNFQLHRRRFRSVLGAVGLPMLRLADADRFRSAEIRYLATTMCVFQMRGGCQIAKTRISAERRAPDLRAPWSPGASPAHGRPNFQVNRQRFRSVCGSSS